ncbi:MAG: leucine-rich repeat domain-containing protein [Clostridia bacterium]|nr:leucine-rich repeat domain-containing protein [Clostridia bacterium]
MRKLIALFTVLALLFCFAGCGDSADVGDITPDGEYPEVTSPESDFECTEVDDKVYVKYRGSNKNVIIPPVVNGKTVTNIDRCFWENETIVSVMIPPTVKEVSNGAFTRCTSLKTVCLFNGIEAIKIEAFLECTSLENIVLPETLTQICNSAFYKCTSLKHITIPGSVKSIDENAFAFSGLETVTIENGVEKIGQSAFSKTQLKELVFPESLKEIATQAFYEISCLESVSLNKGLEEVSTYVFAGSKKITEIVIPETVNKINEFTFDNCTALKKVKFEGDAPEDYSFEFFGDLSAVNVSYTVCYHEGAKGFTSPTWNGYPTEIW